MQVGVSPVLFYDPVERVVATLHPNHTYEKVVFDPWQQTTYDVNDTVAANGTETGDPRTDPDIQGYVARLFRRRSPAPGRPGMRSASAGRWAPQEQRAAREGRSARRHAHHRPLRRAGPPLPDRWRTTGSDPERTRPKHNFATRVELDIEGNQRAVRDAIVQDGDAIGRIVMRYDYDMLGNRIHQASMEAGERWMLNDVAGKPICGWDSRDHGFAPTYDVLRRPTEVYLQEGSASELLVGKTVYGESQAEPGGQQPARQAVSSLRRRWRRHHRRVRLQGQPA